MLRSLLRTPPWRCLLAALALSCALGAAAAIAAVDVPAAASALAMESASASATLSTAATARQPPLVLDADKGVFDAWPAVTMLADPDHSLTLEQARARSAQFTAPVGPVANLGLRREAIWLRVPLFVPTTDAGRWVVSADYPSLDRVDLYLVGATQPPQHLVMGRKLLSSQRPLLSSSHAAMLQLEPGQSYELLLRIETASTMIASVTIATPQRFHAIEARTQLLQGLMAGAALCLLVYSFAQWVGLRDPMFLQYSLTLAGATLFFLAYSGLGPQHLWGENAWLTFVMSPLSVLVGLVGVFLFVDRALEVRNGRLWISRTLRAGSLCALVLGTAFASGVIDYRIAHTGATVLGPLPMLLAIPVAWSRARRGERVGLYMLAGWGVYAVGTLTMAALLRGLVDWNFWTHHAFQFGSLVEMLMWMLVLGARIDELRTLAQKANVDRESLRRLAHTDALTGLPNRRGLNEVLAGVLSGCAPGKMAAVYLLDLDGFKPINDTHGHDVGDALLIGVARRLESLVRSSDTVARLGGDEFVIVGVGLTDENGARALGDKLLDGFSAPLDVDGQAFRVGITIGYALAPLDGREPAGLLKRADAAMYAGKQDGRHCLRRGAASVGLGQA